MAPMGGGGAGMGAQGPGVRGQSPLMRDASAGNQAFFTGNQPGGPASGGTGFGTNAQSVGGGYTPPSEGSGPAGPYDSGPYDTGSNGGFSGWDDEPESEFQGEFSEPVSSDTDGFWGDDRRVAPPVLGEFPPQQ